MSLKDFSEIAQKLSRNPLGIVALFVVLIYGIACLTFSFGNNLPPKAIEWFILFVILYPFIVLFVFYRLVTKHHTKLYAPQDFPRAEDFLKCVYGDQSNIITQYQINQQIPETPIAKEGEGK